MTGHLPSIQSRQGRRSPSLQVIVLVFVALFILFLWLNFVLTQGIESSGREIQVKTRELSVVERRKEALLKEISAAGAQQELADRARELGFQPQTPVYLSMAEPLVQASTDVSGDSLQSAAVLGGEAEWPSQSASSLLDALARQLETSESGDMP